jgi:hypothetical protein
MRPSQVVEAQVNRWELLDSERIPGSDSVMALMRRGHELVIRVDERELMGNRVHGSEDALSDLAFDRLDVRGGDPTRVLVGGLGMGFTLAAALRRTAPEGSVTVAELVPAIIRWNRGVLGEAAGDPLKDVRAHVHEGDVMELIQSPPTPLWDAILLDVDNGPSSLTRATNDGLYTPGGLDACFAALTPGGVLGVWSATPDNAFTRRMQRAGFDAEPISVRAGGPKKGGRMHTVWMGVRRAQAPRWHRPR